MILWHVSPTQTISVSYSWAPLDAHNEPIERKVPKKPMKITPTMATE